MKKQRLLKFGRILLWAYCISVLYGAGASGRTTPFSNAKVIFEQNATDGDVEVVFEVTGGDAGLAKLTVVSPDGRTVIDFAAPDGSTLGIRTFRFESPEPGDVKSLKEAYPEGVYKFSAISVGGEQFYGESALSHDLPKTISFHQPLADAEDVAISHLIIRWQPVENLAAYILEIEQEETEVSITARLPADAVSFTPPRGFLSSGKEYKLAIGTVNGDGNISFVETTFTTAEKE